jgi:hypothetical protein
MKRRTRSTQIRPTGSVLQLRAYRQITAPSQQDRLQPAPLLHLLRTASPPARVSDWPGAKKATLKEGRSESLRERARSALGILLTCRIIACDVSIATCDFLLSFAPWYVGELSTSWGVGTVPARGSIATMNEQFKISSSIEVSSPASVHTCTMWVTRQTQCFDQTREKRGGNIERKTGKPMRTSEFFIANMSHLIRS